LECGVILLGTVAHRVRGLHRLPLIGAPKPTVTFRVNGSNDLVVRLSASPEFGQKPDPRTAQIEVGVANPAIARLDSTIINSLLPMRLLRRKTDASGVTKEEGGQWMPPTSEAIGSRAGPYDYWAEDYIDFPSRSAQLFYFNATFSEPGEYAIRVRMSAPALYEADYDVDGVIRVEIADDGPVERVTDVIAQGAEVRRDLYKASSEEHRHRSGVADFLVFVREVVGRDLPNFPSRSAQLFYFNARTDCWCDREGDPAWR
jgi:hypothetical protein